MLWATKLSTSSGLYLCRAVAIKISAADSQSWQIAAIHNTALTSDSHGVEHFA